MKTKPLRLCCVTNQNSMHIAQFYWHSGVSLRGINDIIELFIETMNPGSQRVLTIRKYRVEIFVNLPLKRRGTIRIFLRPTIFLAKHTHLGLWFMC